MKNRKLKLKKKAHGNTKVRPRRKFRNVIIQPRDLDILLAIVFGVRTILEILKMLREKAGLLGLKLPTLRQRISVLLNGGYIQSDIFRVGSPRRRCALYALTPTGADELITNTTVHHAYIRTGLPSKKMGNHEHMKVSILWSFNDHRPENELLTFLTEEDLRRENARQFHIFKSYKKSKERFPDILIKLETTCDIKFFVIEVDGSTVNSAKIAKKLAASYSESVIIVFICENESRIKAIRHGILKHTNLSEGKNIFFAELMDLCKKGYADILCWNLAGEKRRLNLE